MKQEKSLFEQMGGTYTLNKNGYYYPDIILPVEGEKPIGIWGHRHLRYIKQYKKSFYLELKISGNLNSYLAEIDEQAQIITQQIIAALAKLDGTDEKLKAENPIRWTGLMNNYQHSAEEIIFAELINI